MAPFLVSMGASECLLGARWDPECLEVDFGSIFEAFRGPVGSLFGTIWGSMDSLLELFSGLYLQA